jgi:hypothetical protein
MVVVTCLLLAATAVVGLADEGSGDPAGHDVTQATAISPDALETMSVLATARDSADVIPSEVSEPMDERALFGMNPDLSRLAVGNLSNSVYVIPGTGHVCAILTVGEGANATCPATDDVEDGEAGPATVSLEGEAIAIYGLVPDGVETVTVETGEAHSAQIEVENNAYYGVLPAGTSLRQLTYTGPSGAVAFPIYDPARAFED